ncbi:MAG: histidine kinase [Anaerolineae bacterium]
MFAWQHLPLLTRIRRLRYIVPPTLALLVVVYQLGVARTLADTYGHLVHYSVEIAFYSLAGPMVTWLTLAWVERRLAEKEALEKEVRAQEQHLAMLTAASADAILSLDGRGRITSWNRGAEGLTGHTAEEIVGRPLAILLPEVDALAERLQHNGVVQNFETTALTRDGRRITVDLTQTLLAEDGVESPPSSLIMRDVTARRERAAILEEERARIARDLHDGVAQTLYFLALKADMAARQISQSPDQVSADLKEIGRQTRQVIREVRRTIFALRPLDWSQEGFLPALRRFALDFGEQLGWRVSFQADEADLAIPASLEPTVFRLVQESLNNVAKHAGAGQVWIEMHRSAAPDCLTLTVRDDGQGFDPGASNSGGLGLSQMRQRVAALGGRFSLDSRAEQGTAVTAHLPL